MGRFLPGPTEKLARGGGITWAMDDGAFWSIDLSQSLFGFGSAAALSPFGLTYTRAASSLSAQYGTSSLFDLSFYAAFPDVYVATRWDDSWRAGIALGAARTNLLGLVQFWDGSLPVSGTVTRTANRPDLTGTARATRMQSTSGSILYGSLLVGASTYVCFTNWIKNVTAPADVIHYTESVTGATPYTTTALAVDGAWRRYASPNTTTTGAGTNIYVTAAESRARGAVPAGPKDIDVSFPQLELGKFPSDYIPPVGGVATTRAATFLNLTSAKISEGLIAGRLQLELNLRAQGSLAEIGGTPHLLWADANNRITIDATTGVISILIGGVTNTTTAITLARYDTLDIFVCFGGSVATTFVYRKNGGAWASLVVAGAALGSITPANMWLLSQSTAGSHFDGWLYKVAAYQPNRRPVWSLN